MAMLHARAGNEHGGPAASPAPVAEIQVFHVGRLVISWTPPSASSLAVSYSEQPPLP